MKKAAKRSTAQSQQPARSAAPSRKRAQGQEVEDYIRRTPEPGRRMLKQMRQAIRAVVPPGTAEVISYRIPAFKHKRLLVWYAAFQDHCSLFPTHTVIQQFKDELKGYKTSKGTICFPINQPLPAPLIKRLVRARLKNLDS
jgi:uncharacterized protein YdhG (YjbR/CyaY superfamily)